MDRAYQLAQRYQAQAISLAEVPDYLATVDIVMSSTSSPDFMLSAPMVTEALIQGKRHPLLMIDLAVPADLDPALSMHEDIYLYTVDDLQGVIEQNLQLRQHAATQAEIIIDAQAKEYMSWLQTEQALSTLCAYRQKVTQVKNEALQKALAKLQKGDDPEQVLIHLAHQLSQKLMHGPSIRLRQAGVDQEEYILHSTRELFGLVE
jgi:glutamyl-tRNA reductase